MPLDNKIIQPNELSIHIFVDGFSFCNHSKIEFVPAYNSIEVDFSNALEDLIKFTGEETLTNISVIHFSVPSAFVPKKLFDANKPEQYLKHHSHAFNEHHYNPDHIEGTDQVNVYSFPKSFAHLVEKVNKPTKHLHYCSLLYQMINNLADKHRSQLYFHLQRGYLDLFLTQDGKVIFNNRFSVKTKDEFLYYTFFVVEQFKLEKGFFDLILLGEIAEFEPYYTELKRYHSDYIFYDESSLNSEKIQQHPAPFLAQYFS